MGAFNVPPFNTGAWNGSGTSAIASGSIAATQLIYGALRLIGVLRPGQTASPENLADCWAALNDMLDSWNTERLTVPAITPSVFPLVAGQETYTVGPGAQWDTGATTRPSSISAATYQLTAQNSPVDLPIGILSLAQYIAIRSKAIASTLPTNLYYDMAPGIASLSLWPVPTVVSTLTLYTWQILAAFADLVTGYSFAPGYALALRFNLAVQIAPMEVMAMKTPKVMMASVEAKAREYKAFIKSANLPAPVMRCDPAMLGGRRGDAPNMPNILTGYY